MSYPQSFSPGDKVAVREKSKSLDAIERSYPIQVHVYE
jgi:hypothetical protein